MIGIRGIGWVTGTGYGRIGQGFHQAFQPGEGVAALAKSGVVPTPYRNFGRLDPLSRNTIAAVALALDDAGLAAPGGEPQAIGIAGTARDGSLAADVAYFRDYLENGRMLGRANLFIYTLPTSPLGEAAIQFGLTGPLLYAAAGQAPLAGALDLAAELVVGGEAPRMLAGQADAETALYLLVDRAEGGVPLCTLAEALAIAATEDDLAAMAAQFSALLTRKGAS